MFDEPTPTPDASMRQAHEHAGFAKRPLHIGELLVSHDIDIDRRVGGCIALTERAASSGIARGMRVRPGAPPIRKVAFV
ncbi:hypothetical protein [Burkholderia oklahomensis]|uniref:hypothetical protein n=1 Tax=Burkholderia oklahomensis TaxID=342113 RepID=UPI00016A37E8|nr:hypothetical protein [Burkholderia oklahomensis]AOI42983.1 hypothetical protein WG70_25975 [Burkholderia oklahomensis EO147]KUY63056.1 hypothetical protein WG70_05130 [Burkholderia oklahomensis EO147]QPS37722.1 hypothetical protein I6G57_02335 [Burkholderia oklahomensis]